MIAKPDRWNRFLPGVDGGDMSPTKERNDRKNGFGEKLGTFTKGASTWGLCPQTPGILPL